MKEYMMTYPFIFAFLVGWGMLCVVWIIGYITETIADVVDRNCGVEENDKG